MDKITFSVVAVLLAIFAASCAKKNETAATNPAVNEQTNPPKAVDLSGKSFNEVLALKYDQAALTCALWVQKNHQLDLMMPPNDVENFDLKSELKMPLQFNLSGQIQYHRLEVKLEIDSLSILGSLQLTDTKGNTYISQFSPLADYTLTYKSATYDNFLSVNRSGKNTGRLHEFEIVPVFNESIASSPFDLNGGNNVALSYYSYVQCHLKTKIKAEYQHQFKINPRNP